MSAYPSNEQFTNFEKVCFPPTTILRTLTHTEQNTQVELLVNVLQNLVPDLPSYLLHLILVDLQRQPQWMDISLPKGKLESFRCLP